MTNEYSNEKVDFEIKCSLEDLYYGKQLKFKINRKIYENDIIKNQAETFDLKIEPGSKNNDKIIFEKKGDIYPHKQPKDLIFIIKEMPHKVFRRQKDDLFCTCNISLEEAFNGFTRTIKMLNGKTEIINIKPLLNSKDAYTIEGAGMPIYTLEEDSFLQGIKNYQFGNCIIDFKINFEDITQQKKNMILKILNS